MNPEEIVAQVTNLRAPSQSIVRLANLVSRAEGCNEEVVDLVKQDVVLCAKLLALCNSAQFGLAEPVGSIEQAVFFLGYRQIYRLVLAIGFGGTLSRPLPAYAINDQELWRHSLVTAQIAELVVGHGTPVQTEPSVAYTAGLIHDIGKIAFNQVLEQKEQTAMREMIQQGIPRLEAERAVLQTDHCELGACLLKKWRLPESIVEAVSHHHQPVLEPQPTLSAVVHLANCLAHHVGSAPGAEAFAMSAEGNATAALKIDEEGYAKLIIAAHDQMAQIEQLSVAV